MINQPVSDGLRGAPHRPLRLQLSREALKCNVRIMRFDERSSTGPAAPSSDFYVLFSDEIHQQSGAACLCKFVAKCGPPPCMLPCETACCLSCRPNQIEAREHPRCCASPRVVSETEKWFSRRRVAGLVWGSRGPTLVLCLLSSAGTQQYVTVL